MIRLDAASVLLQWATGGIAFLWVTTRRQLVGLGYGWLLRSIYGVLALGAFAAGRIGEPAALRDAGALGAAGFAAAGLAVSMRARRGGVARFPPALDVAAALVGALGLVGGALAAGGPAPLALLRMFTGAALMGAVTDAMLLGHWYLVQPGLPRAPIVELVRWTGWVWPFEVIALLLPTGMLSVLSGAIDDGYGGILGWMWAVSAITTIGLVIVTHAALKERQYSAVMAATGLLYLAILTAFGTDLLARAVLA